MVLVLGARQLLRRACQSREKTFLRHHSAPNVTGELHMGHAIQHAIHDNVVRRRRMQGYETLCLPGTDHAGIATQMQVEKRLDGVTRYDLGRESSCSSGSGRGRRSTGDTIYRQLRQLGCSYDWSRSRFTLDDDYVEAVLLAFERFHDNGWIYRGTRMINWCPSCRSVISDLETEGAPSAGQPLAHPVPGGIGYGGRRRRHHEAGNDARGQRRRRPPRGQEVAGGRGGAGCCCR